MVPISSAVRHFIFGYGSLICPLSRSITAPTLAGVPATPALIYHMERTWSARIDGPKHHLEGFTAMGVRLRRGKKCSGVLIEVDEEELHQFDVRETGYDRKLIDLEHIHRIPNLGDDLDDEDHIVFHRSELARRRSSINGSSGAGSVDGEAEEDEKEESNTYDVDEGIAESEPEAFLDTTLDVAENEDVRVWVYLQREHRAADKNYPIHQSYVDIILRGCLSISEGFARSFLDTTNGWYHDGDGGDICYDTDSGEEGTVCPNGSEQGKDYDADHHTWVEDRHLPLYIRADPKYSNSFGDKIDALVRDHHPEALDKRRKLLVEEDGTQDSNEGPEPQFESKE
mmetsp:Transcript_8236/g.17817  ORF Transcript_8236/g.17817 Transcript_8236/m.17817 type:complete len:341 (+) Transcript_8236:193-1215(+)